MNEATTLSSLTQKGIYKSFDDFKNNTPWIVEFELKKGKITDELYVNSGTSSQVLPEYWGFYDGKQLFIKSGYNAFPAVQQQNSFEVYGSKFITHTQIAFRNAITGVVWGASKKVLDKKILQLNMETGEFH